MDEIPEIISVLRKTLGTLSAMRYMQEQTMANALEISGQTATQLQALNTAMDIAYRNREILSCGQASIDLVNAIQTAVFCNYEIIKYIKRYADEAKIAMIKLREVDSGGV